MNVVDVDDVAEGHWLAYRAGPRGERYILGHANLMMRELLELLAADLRPQGAAHALAVRASRSASRMRTRSCRRLGAARAARGRAHRARDPVREQRTCGARARAAPDADRAPRSRRRCAGSSSTPRKETLHDRAESNAARVGARLTSSIDARAGAGSGGAQLEPGYWWAELESNATMDAEYILMTHFLGARDDAIWRGIAQDIRSYQRDDGSWALYAGAPGDLSTTIECYFALKLAGDAGAHLERAREFILDARRHRRRPRVHAHLARAVRRVELGRPAGDAARADAAAGARADQHLPVRVVGARDDRPAAHPDGRSARCGPCPRARAWPTCGSRRAAPLGAARRDRSRCSSRSTPCCAAISACRGTRCGSARSRAAERWILDHQEADGSWGGIQPPWVYSLMALHALGYAHRAPGDRSAGLDGMHGRWMVRRDGRQRSACRRASRRCGTPRSRSSRCSSPACVPSEPAIVQRARDGCCNEEVRVPGDWCVWVRDVAAERLVVRVRERSLSRHRRHRDGAARRSTAPAHSTTRRATRALAWIFAMQSESGGWAAFDKDNTSRLPALIPFADFGEMIESAERGRHRARRRDARRARLRSHAPRGRARDRLPVRAAGARGLVVRPLGREPHLRRRARCCRRSRRSASRWTASRCGAPCAGSSSARTATVASAKAASRTSSATARGRGPSTPSQTAWALLALDRRRSRRIRRAARRAADYLAVRSAPTAAGTRTRTPAVASRATASASSAARGSVRAASCRRGFMLRYHLYRNCFPLLALGRYRERSHRRVADETVVLPARLDVVSRSFALCIPQLEPPFRDHVALAYLLLRVLDTVEDAPFTDGGLQQRQFERLRGFLRDAARTRRGRRVRRDVPGGSSPMASARCCATRRAARGRARAAARRARRDVPARSIAWRSAWPRTRAGRRRCASSISRTSRATAASSPASSARC